MQEHNFVIQLHHMESKRIKMQCPQNNDDVTKDKEGMAQLGDN